jgi:hypothetical protein
MEFLYIKKENSWKQAVPAVRGRPTLVEGAGLLITVEIHLAIGVPQI